MKYISIDELNYFSFHDARLLDINLNNGNMRWIFDGINVTTQNSQNSHDKDMCTEEGEIVFEDVKIEDIVFGSYEVYDSNQVLIESAGAKTANPDEYDDILKKTMSDHCYIYGMEELSEVDGKRHEACFGIFGGAGYFDITLSFTKVIVQWDEFYGIAWYEDEKWK